MRPTPLPDGRHARLFELIRQGNLAELRRETPMPEEPEETESDRFRTLALRSLAS